MNKIILNEVVGEKNKNYKKIYIYHMKILAITILCTFCILPTTAQNIDEANIESVVKKFWKLMNTEKYIEAKKYGVP